MVSSKRAYEQMRKWLLLNKIVSTKRRHCVNYCHCSSFSGVKILWKKQSFCIVLGAKIVLFHKISTARNSVNLRYFMQWRTSTKKIAFSKTIRFLSFSLQRFLVLSLNWLWEYCGLFFCCYVRVSIKDKIRLFSPTSYLFWCAKFPLYFLCLTEIIV